MVVYYHEYYDESHVIWKTDDVYFLHNTSHEVMYECNYTGKLIANGKIARFTGKIDEEVFADEIELIK